MQDDVIFVHEGQPVDRADSRRRPIVVAGSDEARPGLALGFESDDSLRRWAETAGSNGEQILRTLNRRQQLQARRGSEGDKLAREALDRMGRMQAGAKKLAERTGHAAGSEALIRRAMEQLPDDPPVFESADPSWVWDGKNLTGANTPIGGWAPDLGPAGWSNRISSAFVLGICTLWDGAWFSGQAIFLFGLFFPFTDLGAWPFFFDNRATSFITN